MRFSTHLSGDRVSNHMRASLSVNLLVPMLVLFAAPVAFAQGERASITGTVTDASGAIVTDASVTVRDTATNVTTKTVTTSAGLYFVTSLPPDNYDLTV